MSRTAGFLLAPLLAAAALAADPNPERDAIALYDQGEYAKARDMLAQMDAAGEISGPLLYRLHYAQMATGQDGAAATLERAIAKLEQEVSAALTLEVPFYLVNAYQNVSRTVDARRVCEQAVQRVESGAVAEPADAVEQFRLGKLYADLGRKEPATRWYTAAIEGLEGAEATSGPYLRWASRYLAEPAFQSGDHASAARHYREVVKDPSATAVDYDRLGVSEYRTGRYKEASAAWAEAAKRDQVDPDRLRYTSRLADLASDVGTLPATAPDGRAWGAMPAEELQAFMQDQVARARPLLEEARQPVSLPEERIAELRAAVREAKTLFAAAGLEYAVRGYGIREAAFFGGYARMIFHKAEWRVSQGTAKQRAKQKD